MADNQKDKTDKQTMKKMEKKKENVQQTNESASKNVGLSNSGAIAKGSAASASGVKLFQSVGTKLLLAIFCSILACVLTVGLLAYGEAKSIVERKVSGASLQTVNQVATNLDIIFSNFEDITMQVLINKDFHSKVNDMLSGGDDYAKLVASKDISDMLQNFSLSNNAISGILMIPLSDKLMPITSGGTSTSKIDEIKQSDWFKQTIELSGKTNWISSAEGISLSNSEPTIGVARVLKNSITGEANYMILIEIKPSAISERYEKVELGEGSDISIVDNNGNYVINDNQALIGQKVKVELAEESVNGAEKLSDSDGKDVLAAYSEFETMNWKLVGTIPVGELVKDANAIKKLTWITAVAAAIIAILIGMVIVLTIARPLIRICQLMVQGAGGDLTVRSSIRKRHDEIGNLSENFNRMMIQITELAVRSTRSAEEVLFTATDLTDASRKTSISAKEIAVATEEIANGATSLAVEAEKGNDLTVHINDQMKQVIEANREMVASASDVERASGQGVEHMGLLIEKTGQTENMTRSMVEKVDALKESTGSIVKILDVLNSLTKQTNILSLNATIEAARAGTAGKGFMVVADEIRKLADQSRQSIDVVAQITEKIQAEIGETVQVLSEAYPLFQEQIGSVKEANGIFLSVQEQMGHFAKRLDSVTTSVGQLDQSQSVLSEAMTNVSAVAEEASATSEEVASLSNEQLSISQSLVQLSEKLDAVSKGLKESLSQFKIE
ncbi:methyl-accepting chemotaxis protein [Paenibacillus sp. HB172176]|uniref:methyl-accepting chemotaxis protein n=1 Tax=Paenibacillus sp. HB172176 TaxID=2493690 RepID=UPI001F10DC16|nr:methyl-accepting chemotaxis protein [Paenibacillus sp. HB172176]